MVELAQRVENDQPFHDLDRHYLPKRRRNREERRPPFLEDLDSLPFPALHLWEKLGELRKYGTIPYPVMTSRGCVFWCNFCTTVSMFGRKYRMRTPKNVVDELEYFIKITTRTNSPSTMTPSQSTKPEPLKSATKSTAAASKSNGTAKPASTWSPKNSSSKCVKQVA